MGAGASKDEVEIPTSASTTRDTTNRDNKSNGSGSAHPSKPSTPAPPASAKSGVKGTSGRPDSKGWQKVQTYTRAMSGITGKRFRTQALEHNKVHITRTGFSQANVTIEEGQAVLWTWNEPGGPGFNVTQVIHNGAEFIPVKGGFTSGEVTKRGPFEQVFNLEGEYKFVSAGLRTTPLTITVKPRSDYQAEVTDEGFMPKIIRINEGRTVKWNWKTCNIPHSVWEVKYCAKHCAFSKVEKTGKTLAVPTGSYRQEFRHPGLYYFQTQGASLGEHHLCVVHVKQSQRDHKVEILDRTFSPMILMIDEGDRVWFHWDKFKCKKLHAPYQIEEPSIDQRPDEDYKAAKDGFFWLNPSRAGLMACEFPETGIFFFSDRNTEMAAEYVGTIIVRPKQREHFVEVTPDGFYPDLLITRTGDRIWWHWQMADMVHPFSIVELEKCITPPNEPHPNDLDCQNKCKKLDDLFTKVCSFVQTNTIQLNSIGVQHYRISDSEQTFSVITNPGPRNHTIQVLDNKFDKMVLTVHPFDRVWWVWQTGKKQHNIIQVTHTGQPLKGGFCSGHARDCPSAYVYQFKEPGVYYYVSSNIADVFGAVIVSSQPRVRQVQVSNSAINPDPMTISPYDIVCWVFSKGFKSHDIHEVKNADDVIVAKGREDKMQLIPRPAMNKVFVTMGVHHFYSKSFAKRAKSESGKKEEDRLSSILVDESSDSAIVRLDKRGFHPNSIAIPQGHSILWTWKDAEEEEEHNIIHVNPPDSDSPLSVIHGTKSFNSGRPVKKNSFLYTFDNAGTFCVASQGAPGFAGVIRVLQSDADRCDPPHITSGGEGGHIEKFHKLQLASNSASAKIYYTTDGTSPLPHNKASKLYNPEKGVSMKDAGLMFLRAVAVSDDMLPSEIYTSRRFWVLSQEVSGGEESDSDTELPDVRKFQLWNTCNPSIKGCFTGPGTMEVFWEKPEEEAVELIRGYQILFNGVSYCEVFPPVHSSVSVAGLAGGRSYEITLEVYPKDPMFLPHRSEPLIMNCPVTTEMGGPVISLEMTTNRDSMAIVWRSISTAHQHISGYMVYLNGQQCGSKVVPSKDSNRCKVVIDGCRLDVIYKVVVAALPSDGSKLKPKMSNQLEVSLPLDNASVVLPEPQFRSEDEDIYKEYIEVREGSGYLARGEDEKKHQKGNASAHRSRPVSPTVASYNTPAHFTAVDIIYPDMPANRDSGIASPDCSSANHDSPLLKSADLELTNNLAGKLEEGETDELQGAHEIEEEEEEYDQTAILEPRERGLTPITEKSTPEPTIVEVEAEIETDRSEVIHGGSVVQEPQEALGAVTHVPIRDDAQPGKSKKKSIKPKPPVAPKSTSQRQQMIQQMLPQTPQQESAIVEVHDTAEMEVEQEEEEEEDEEREKPTVTAAASAAAVLGTASVIANQEEYDYVLPPPKVKIEHQPASRGELVSWELEQEPDPQYRIQVFVVNVLGVKFAKGVNSDISYEILEKDENGMDVQIVQHSWNVTTGTSCLIRGLLSNMSYRVFVVANYIFDDGKDTIEYQSKSAVISYSTLSAPQQARLKPVSVDFYSATLEWTPGVCHDGVQIAGYQVVVDGKKLGSLLSKDTKRTTLDKLQPGKTLKVWIVTRTKHPAGNSPPSNTVYVSCPMRPQPPAVYHQPSFKRGCVVIGWTRPPMEHCRTKEEDISWYSIFVDDQYHGEVKANPASNKNGYQYYLTDLRPGQIYDVYVRAYAGVKKVQTFLESMYALVESEPSNIIPVMCAAPPKAPQLKIEGLHFEGVDVTWDKPQQYGDAIVSGYQLFKDGKLYGSVIPPDVHTLRVRDVSLGDKVTLQLRALTEHPVGRMEKKSPDLGISMPLNDGDSGIDGSSHIDEKEHGSYGEKYTSCKLGPKLVVHYTGLVQAPTKVWCEHVTGHSAMIVWNKAEQPKAHFVSPDMYQVTWWPGIKPEENIVSQSTKDDHMLIGPLNPNATYTVVVEARKMQQYSEVHGGEIKNGVGKIEDEADSDFEDTCSTFILTAQSDHLTIHTAQPPDPPRNLGILATTCNSIKIGWDPPKEHGVEVLGIRVDCSPKKPEEGKHQSFELIPDARSLVIENLTELTSYLVVVTAITEEYFDQLPERHQYKKMHRIPRDVAIELNESPWLPNTSIVAITSGTEAPYNIRVKRSTGTSIVVGWQAPVVHGTNRLQGIMVRWCEARLIRNKEDETALVSHINLMPEETEVTIEDLMIGMEYKITVEAVVSVRTIIDLQKGDHENRRTAHIVGKPLWARTKAPCEPPKLYITGYSTSTIQLYWEKPVLFTVLGKEEEDKRYLKRCLEGYKLEINGKLHMRLGPAAQSVTLTKCKYAKTYSVVLVAMTCTEEVKKERVKRIQLASSSSFTSSQPFDDHDLDESASEAVEVRVPRLQEGNIANISAFYNHKSSNRDGVMGDITLTWDVQGNWSRTKQFDILWHCHEDGVVHRKCVESDVRKCTIPVVRNKCTYEISMEPRFGNDAMPVTLTKLQVLIPGPPDAPTIWTKHVGKEEFSMEWGEPRLYGGVKVKGYQVYMNDRKVGNELSNSHRKAIIPCKPNRHYKINLKAISADMDFGDSALSNTLFISTSLSQGGQILADAHDENVADLSDQGSVDGDQELIVRVAKVTHTSIHLDWFTYSPPEGIACYKMQWTSVAQPTQREFKLSPQESSCILQKCYPGTNHFIRLVALGADGRILEKSKQVVVQTSAPPEAPVVSLRACNFNYTAIQWEKPTTFGVANITGYKVYVNGVVEAVVGPDQYHYCYTKGQGCKEYVYQVKALTADDQLCSKPSEPFVVTWPGMKTPLLQRVPTVSSNSIKVMWEEPYVTEGVKIKNYRVYLEDESSGMTVQTIFPIHPDVREAEFHNLKQGIYLVYLEILVYNSNTVFRADPIRVQPRIAPDPPQITVTVAGLEERRQIERVTCELLNKRDKLLRNLNNPTLMGAASVFRKKDSGEVSSRTSENLQHVESMLVDCFSSINHYTGHLMAHVSWQCPQSDPDMVVSGYKVLVDGKQYGSTLHSGMRTVRIKLSMEKTSHRVSMVAITNQPYASSLESNVVELLTEPFRQFTFYCFHNVHSKGSLWPNSGACQYEDTYAAERRLPGRRLVNQGLLKRRVPPPSCNVIDIFTGDIKSLLPPGGPNGPTAILFWTKWCLTSQRIMAHYVKFARENSKSYDFISVACNSGDRDGTVDELIHLLTNNSWRDDSHIWHCTSLKQKTGVVETSQTSHSPNLTRTGSGQKSKKGTLPISSDTKEDSQQQEDVASLYGVIGVPTLVIIHPEDYIAWQGRFCAFEYESFENGMHHTFSEALGEACTVPGCELCKQDFYMKVDTPPTAADAYHYTKPKPGKVASAVVANEKDSSGVPLITTPAIGATVTPKTESSFGGGSRPYSAGRPGSATRRPELSPFKQPASLTGKLFMKAGKAGKHDNRISVSQRPFSASKTRPGSAKRMGSAK